MWQDFREPMGLTGSLPNTLLLEFWLLAGEHQAMARARMIQGQEMIRPTPSPLTLTGIFMWQDTNQPMAMTGSLPNTLLLEFWLLAGEHQARARARMIPAARRKTHHTPSPLTLTGIFMWQDMQVQLLP